MTGRPELVAALGRTALFGALPEKALADVAARMTPVSYEPGELIFARGDEGRDVHLVMAGSVRLSVMTVEGRELSLLQAGPGEILGEIAVLDGRTRTTDARAVGKVQTMRLSRTVLNGLIESDPVMAKQAIAFLCARLRSTNEVLEGIALYPIESRIARFLLSSVRIKGDAGATKRNGTVQVQLGLSQGDLALLIGASRPKVSTALQSLEASGAIRREGDTTHCNVAELERLAEGG